MWPLLSPRIALFSAASTAMSALRTDPVIINVQPSLDWLTLADYRTSCQAPDRPPLKGSKQGNMRRWQKSMANTYDCRVSFCIGVKKPSKSPVNVTINQ